MLLTSTSSSPRAMSPNSASQNGSPLPKRLKAPLPPSPHRTTSQLSVVSVEAHTSDDHRPLLSQTVRRRSTSAPLSDRLPLPFASNSSSITQLTSAGPSRRNSGSTPASPSRKGKERAVEELGDTDVDGTILQVDNEDAEKHLEGLISGGGEDASLADLETSQTILHNQRTYSPRRYFVLTNAGKLVFASPDTADEDLSNLMGIAQAVISIIADDNDKLRSISRGSSRIAFILKSPLYLFCVSDWGEPEHVLRVHLDYVYLQILSVISSTQLARVFQRRSNFDLSRLLEGTENFLHSLIKRTQTDFSHLTATLTPLRMAPALRETAAAALVPPSKFKDLLYVLLIAGGHIVTLLRPRKHSIHPSDLHLLLNTLESSPTLRASESWVPMCFPKFNPAGFVHAYVSYVMEDVGLVFVSADREAFEDLQGWKNIVLEKLEKDSTLTKIQQSIPLHPYSAGAVGCPGLLHFIYKSRPHVQITSPKWQGVYAKDGDDRKRLITLYQKLHDAEHARSGQSAPLRLVYIRTDYEAVLAWVTKPFELYLAVNPQMTKSGVVGVANSIARWVAAEEGRLFLKDAPVF